jgi:hypothetical protein
MNTHNQPMQAVKAMNIQTRVCPCGSVYLYVGHTCVYLREEEFLDLAQVIQATEQYMREQDGPIISEQRH